ncbi:MAG: hypothetical protein ACK52I_24770, partial [Pseudomonadota bacterium]
MVVRIHQGQSRGPAPPATPAASPCGHRKDASRRPSRRAVAAERTALPVKGLSVDTARRREHISRLGHGRLPVFLARIPAA